MNKSSTASNVGIRSENIDSREVRAIMRQTATSFPNEVKIDVCMKPIGTVRSLSLVDAGELYVELGLAIKNGLEKQRLINGTWDRAEMLRSRDAELRDLVDRGIISLNTYHRELGIPVAPLDTTWCSQCETHVIAIVGGDGNVHCPYCNRNVPATSK